MAANTKDVTYEGAPAQALLVDLPDGKGGGTVFAAATEISFTASTSPTEIAANPDRSDLYFVNNSTTIAVWANEFGTAVSGSAGQRVGPGQTFVATTPNAVSVVTESSTAYCSGAEA